jgi:hypothetical protein
MNSLERLQNRLRGAAVDRPPNLDIVMTFAAQPGNDNIPFVEHFLDCLEGKAEPMMPVERAAKHLNVLFKILA